MKGHWMKRIIVVCVVLLAACSVRAAEDAAAAKREEAFKKAVAEMKKELGSGFIVERAGAFVVGGNLSRRSFNRTKKHTIEDCAAALWNDFFTVKPDYPIKIYLFRGKDSYEKWVKRLAGFEPSSPFGFYLPSKKSMMMNIATGGGTLVHEMTHALTEVDFPGCPTWFFEGLGSLFEQCYVTRDGHIRGAVNWRLPVLRKGGFVPLQGLIEMTEAAFRGKEEPLNYANARYLCLYLQQRGLLRKFYKTFRDAHKAKKDKTGWTSFKQVVQEPPAPFEKKWHAWVKTLKWPPR